QLVRQRRRVAEGECVGASIAMGMLGRKRSEVTLPERLGGQRALKGDRGFQSGGYIREAPRIPAIVSRVRFEKETASPTRLRHRSVDDRLVDELTEQFAE